MIGGVLGSEEVAERLNGIYLEHEQNLYKERDWDMIDNLTFSLAYSKRLNHISHCSKFSRNPPSMIVVYTLFTHQIQNILGAFSTIDYSIEASE
jgi:hypothetical protein